MSKRKTVQRFVVTVPALVSMAEMANYIRTAVRWWNGQYVPEHPLFDALYKTTVKPLPVGMAERIRKDVERATRTAPIWRKPA